MSVQTELEAKFIHVPENFRETLQKVGAKCVKAERLMRRRNFDSRERTLQKTGGWIRVRDEGDKVTLSYKQLQNRSVTGTKEISVDVSDFDTSCAFLETIGFESYTYQETKRESWVVGEVQIEIDTWPWMPSFIEIEAPSEELLWQTVDDLGLKKAEALFGSVEIVYQHYYNVTEEEVDAWPEIKFCDVPGSLQEKKKQ